MKMRCLAGLVALVAASAAAADTITVCADGCDFTLIRKAIEVANDGDVIQLSAETYYEGDISNQSKSISIIGTTNKDGQPTSILDGQKASGLVYCGGGSSVQLVLENLVIRNGYENNNGGGVFISNDTNPTLTNCRFIGNHAGEGGGLWSNGSPNLINCTFIGNGSRDNHGGAIHMNNSGSLSLSNCTFMGNSASDSGGAIYFEENSQIQASLTNCTLTTNWSDNYGGAIFAGRSTHLTMESCSLEGNQSGSSGGGIHITGATVLADHCSFVANISDAGSALYARAGGTTTIQNCNFKQNTHWGTAVPAAAIQLDEGSTALLYESVICDNVPMQILGGWADKFGNCVSEQCSECDQETCNADINGDGIVDGADLSQLLGAWGVCP